MLLDANEPYNLHLNKLAYRLAIGCYLTRKSCGYIRYSVALLILMLQRKKVSPKGLTFARCALDGTTSLAARSVALWLVAPVGFCL